MVLATHAIIGAAAGRLVSSPWLAFVIGFASHFFIDAIPHWDHSLKSFVKDEKDQLNNDMVLNRGFVWDLARLGTDTLAGFAISSAFFTGAGRFGNFGDIFISAMAGAVGGVFPDFLQFVYFKFRRQPLIFIQKFHLAIHTKKKLAKFPYGILSQVVLSFAAIIVSKLIK